MSDRLKRLVVGAALAGLAMALVSGLGSALRGDGGFRPAGLTLLAEAAKVQSHDAEALKGPALPLPVLVTAKGRTWFGGPDPVSAGAAGGALLMGLAGAFITLAGFNLGGWLGGLGALLGFTLYPGTLFHARTLGPEATITASYALLLLAATMRRPIPQAALGTVGLLCCLASAHESILMIIPWLAAAHFLAPRGTPNDELKGTTPLGRVAPAVFVPVLAAPLLLIALWPHLEVDLVKRWTAVIYDPFRHAHPAVLVMGEVRDQVVTRGPNALQGALVTLSRIPLTLGLLAALGGVGVIRDVKAGRTGRRALFALLGLATVWLMFALNGSPNYAGLDGAMATVPMLCVLAALGLVRVAAAARETRFEKLAPIVVPLLLLGPMALELAAVYPAEQAYHNALMGGPAGAAENGMETRTDAILPRDFVAAMNDQLPQRARVAPYPGADDYRRLLDDLKQWGLLRDDIESAAPYHATYLLIPRHPGEAHFGDLTNRLQNPSLVWEHGGVRHLMLHPY